MTGPWTPECMNVFIAASEDQLVPVQNVLWRSRTSAVARFPSEDAACRAIRSAWTKNTGRYRHDRTRRRVIETTGTDHIRESTIFASAFN